MEAMDMKKKLAQKMANLAQDIGKMNEDGACTNSKGAVLYKYISANSINTKLRGLLLKHNLWIFTSYVDYSERDFETTTDYGTKITTRTVVMAEHEIVDLETGYSITLKSIGADQDGGGKSCGQAETESSKRWMFKNLFITSSDEIDPDGREAEIKKTPLKKTSAKALFMAKALEAGYDKKEVADLANKTFNNDPSEENVQKWLDAGNEIVGKDEFYAE